MVQFSFRMPDDMKARLDAIAAEEKRSVAFIVKEAIEQYFDRIDKEKEK